MILGWLVILCVCALQAQLVDLRSELTDVQAEKAVVEKEVHEQLLQLHAMQLKLQAKGGQAVDSDSIKDRMVGTASDSYKSSRTKTRFYI